MRYRKAIDAFAALAALCITLADGRAWDETQYPDFKGQWRPIGEPERFDTSKGWGLGQQAPLTPEYQALFEADLKDQAAGGQGLAPTNSCISPGMPRVTNGYGQMEVVVTPRTTYITVEHINDNRRIYTDGRGWPAEFEPTYLGYSIGTWIDTDGDGRYDVLEVETRGFQGPRTYDDSGIPLHEDNLTVVRERIYLDKSDPDIFHDEVTVIDHALTRPWVVTKSYHREADRQPYWREVTCAENNNHVEIGRQDYLLSPEGRLMPTRKGQPPPDLRYFNRSGREGQ
ncbi:MAG TPA: hypothetical protein VKC66_08195 [Xanthobacteraceae bacterium]|nr:hypothetical protein [Xanthobacteraceae bacterium]